MELEWKEEYSLNIRTIDDQHKKLLGIINKLSSTNTSMTVTQRCMGAIDELESYAIYHFGEEERFFKRFDYTNKKDHIHQHRKFMVIISEFRSELERLNDEKEIAQVACRMHDYLQGWFIDHIMGEDRKYVPLFKEKNVI